MKALLIFACLFLMAPAIGQKHGVLLNYKPSLTYFGKQNQRFNHYHFASRRGDKTFNSAATILYSYQFSSKVSFTTGLEYSEQGQNINFNADSAYRSYNKQIFKIELNYVRVPLSINYSIFRMTKSKLNIYSGVSFGIAAKREDNYQDIILENILLPPAEKRYKKRDWAITAGMNYEKDLTSNLFANFGLDYLIGLSDAFSEDGTSRFGVLSEFDNAKQNRLALTIGIGFRLTK